MVIGIFSVKNNRYHPNRRLLEAALSLGDKATLVHPKNFLIGIKQDLRVDQLNRVLKIDVLLPRIGATVKEYGLTMIRH